MCFFSALITVCPIGCPYTDVATASSVAADGDVIAVQGGTYASTPAAVIRARVILRYSPLSFLACSPIRLFFSIVGCACLFVIFFLLWWCGRRASRSRPDFFLSKKICTGPRRRSSSTASACGSPSLRPM
ncbi:hypothetical protein TW95_gp1002 [Pandoravirus inopinatum]|uniref:Uncharacterized protein n=1 Tax=Pandoravirus inopinatum TaxID=1605721 RepID=A0A0B5JA31_9VIRU|nr:hypothetical protein TW95_gp1002 [Pandoravirus inopinatum]AJF97736.1 hypothetical protein [Pandoravirus inopinatum]